MSDRLFYSLAAAVTLAMVLLALVWPQGTGQRSPGPFGHAVVSLGKPSASSSGGK